MRVIWLKMSTREPLALRRGSSLSSSTILPVQCVMIHATSTHHTLTSMQQEHHDVHRHHHAPEFSTRCSPVVKGGPGSAP